MSNNSATGRVRRALISVSDKSGLVELAKFLESEGVEILSTGGTMSLLSGAGIKVKSVSDFTGAPEILDGRVKTLHPKIAAGILYVRDNKEHQAQMEEHKYEGIDLVVVNLYPFAQTVAKGAADEEIIENIDIGGPTLIRAAAKNFDSVAVLVDASQYTLFVEDFKSTGGVLSNSIRRKLAGEAFELVREYDQSINNYFKSTSEGGAESSKFPDQITISLKKSAELRYGENPHQSAALYRDSAWRGLSIVDAEQLAGKELSYNNYADLDAVLGMIADFESPFACIVKHSNPCGAACAEKLEDAYRDALASDPMSAYGSIIGLNRKVDMATAHLLHETEFVECIIAPEYEKEAVELLSKKKLRRLLQLPSMGKLPTQDYEFKNLHGGFLYQTADKKIIGRSELKIASKVQPTNEQINAMLFGFQLVKHLKSNAIVIVDGAKMVGFGCGQTSRVDAVENAIKKAGSRVVGGVLASDAFFPMPDGVEAAANAGVKAIIHPGGSKRDEDVFAAADRLGIAMVVTGIRHFKH